MNWFKSLFGRRAEPDPPPTEPPTDDPGRGSRPPEAPEPETAVVPGGDWTVLLATAGFLTERISETLQRLTGVTAVEADDWVASAPVVIMREVDEATALKAQRELQMYGAVVEIVEGEATAVAPLQSPRADSVEAIETDWGDHEVYLMELGQPAAPAVAFLNSMIAKYETPQAIEYLARQTMARKRPILTGLSAQSAEDVALRLEWLGADARAYHTDDPTKPEYGHNHFGAVLVSAGPNATAVASELQAILDIDAFAARQLVDGAPSVIIENVTVDEAIAVLERLRPHGAELELPGPERNVWLDTSTDHIHPTAGPYRLVVQRVGEMRLALSEVVAGLRPDLDATAVADLLDHLPAVVLTGVDLPTAELAAMKLRDFGGTAVWQKDYDAGAALHPQSPTFGVGELTVVLEGYDRFAKVRVIKWLFETRPGLRLTEVMPLVEGLPAFVADEVDMATAVRLRDELLALNATARILDAEGTAVG